MPIPDYWGVGKPKTIDEEIRQLVIDGYQQAAFTKKSNANKFIKEWKKTGMVKKVTRLRTNGPTIEEPNEYVRQAYYTIVDI
jgi:hypothetical protein